MRFVNLNNFLINVSRYCPLREMYKVDLSTGEEVTERKGELLACLCWSMGYDYHFIEFVMRNAGCI